MTALLFFQNSKNTQEKYKQCLEGGGRDTLL